MSRGRILAVDDQRYFRELIEAQLTEAGYQVQTCASGEEALQALDHATFDVIVTDLVMPVMTGADLVQRIKERDPEQEIVVVTGVVDVQSAVDAMKIGATDYLLKPFDELALSTSLDQILQRSRLRQERDRLLAENIEYLGERSLFERALGLFSATSLEAVCEKLLDGLCRETGAQGGVLWRAEAEGPAGFRLAAAHGLVRPDEERERIAEHDLPEPLRVEACVSCIADWRDPDGLPRPSLLVALRDGGALVALVRLTDKLGGDAFDDVDRAAAERFAQFAQTAHRNAERVRQLERQSLQDADTGVYRLEYLHGVVRSEIEKANRFGRRFSLLKLCIEPLEGLRARMDEPAYRHWHATLARFLTRLLRSTDVLALEGDGQFSVLLAESDAIGAATFKRRTRQALENTELIAGIQGKLRPEVFAGCASYPADATQLESLLRTLDARLADDRRSREVERALTERDCGEALAQLLGAGGPELGSSAESLVRFAVAEVGRRPRDRGLLICRPGERYADAFAEGLSLRHERGEDACDVIALADPKEIGAPTSGVTWLSPDALPGAPPFALHFGEGPAYVLVADEKDGPAGPRLFHSAERGLIESLAFRLDQALRGSRQEAS